MLTVCTGMWNQAYEIHGKEFLEKFDRHWPKDVSLLCYADKKFDVPRGGWRNLWDVPGCFDFRERHKNSAMANGRLPMEGWRPKDHQRGYTYRHDAVKWAPQAMIPRAALFEGDADILVWLDADVMTNKDVPDNWVDELLGDYDVAYLGRGRYHSEIGFLAFRLPAAQECVISFSWFYESDEVFKLPEWHSAYVFDHVRKRLERKTGLKTNNLTPSGYGHVWFQSPLAEYTDHLKGQRKHLGYSPEGNQ